MLIDRDRAASIECANAHLRNRRLQRFNVRGLVEPRAVVLWHALAHHLKRMMALNFVFAARQDAGGRRGTRLRPARPPQSTQRKHAPTSELRLESARHAQPQRNRVSIGRTHRGSSDVHKLSVHPDQLLVDELLDASARQFTPIP